MSGVLFWGRYVTRTPPPPSIILLVSPLKHMRNLTCLCSSFQLVGRLRYYCSPTGFFWQRRYRDELVIFSRKKNQHCSVNVREIRIRLAVSIQSWHGCMAISVSFGVMQRTLTPSPLLFQPHRTHSDTAAREASSTRTSATK